MLVKRLKFLVVLFIFETIDKPPASVIPKEEIKFFKTLSAFEKLEYERDVIEKLKEEGISEEKAEKLFDKLMYQNDF